MDNIFFPEVKIETRYAEVKRKLNNLSKLDKLKLLERLTKDFEREKHENEVHEPESDS